MPFLAGPAAAQALTPSPQQLQMLQQLTPQQRQAAMDLLEKRDRRSGKSARTTGEDKGAAGGTLPQPSAKAAPEEEREEEPRFEGGDTLIVYFDQLAEDDESAKRSNRPALQPADEDKDGEQRTLKLARDRMLFTLDKYGVMEMAHVGRIALAGLTEEEAAARIGLEPLLADYYVSVKRLPVEPIGAKALKPFGYELFRPQEDGREDESVALDGPAVGGGAPVPADYVVGPGDSVFVQLFGKENIEYELTVSRDGTLAFPGVGAVSVAGLTFDEVKETLKRRVTDQFIGVKANVTMGELRAVRVFVMGEVERPGAYAVSALSTVTDALFEAGGISEIGSLRNIAVKRQGKLLKRFDLYDLLLQGDNRSDVRLQSGDVIYVAAVGQTVAVSGEVRRPAIYELDQAATAAEVIELAGGLLPEADGGAVKLERVTDAQGRRVIDVDLTSNSGRATAVRDGDLITVEAVPERVEQAVKLEGHVLRTGWFQWRPGLRISDVIRSPAQLKPLADLEYVLVRRQAGPDQSVEAVSTSLREVFARPGGAADLVLEPKDQVMVFDLSEARALTLLPLIQRLKEQARSGRPAQIVRVNGQVRAEGTYPLEPGMRVSDLLRAGGRLEESAFTLEAELTRFVMEEGQPRQIRHVGIDLAAVLTGAPAANLTLQPYDLLTIKEVPQWAEQEQVEIRGEVRFPGTYPIRRGETLGSLLERAGGLTGFAYPEGAVFMRQDLREREQERMDSMAANLEAELTRLSLEGDETANAQTLGMVRQLLSEIRSTQAAGRLVIDLTRQDRDETGPGVGGTLDLVLKGGDRLFIPMQMQEVTVIGEVFHPTSHLHSGRLSWKDYVGLSGGMTQNADEDRVYVVRANGSVQTVASRFFDRSLDVRPGDTVVVPLDADRVRPLKLWTDVSQILYQLGIAVASWKTVGLF